MADIVRKRMNVVFLVLLLLVAILALQAIGEQPAPGSRFAHAGTGDGAGGPALRVSGEGAATGKPDVAYVNLSVETAAATARQAQEQNAGRMSRVLAALQAAGLPKDAVQTMAVNLYPEYGEYKGGPPRVVGYRAVNQIRVTVNSLDRLGPVIDGAVEAGANRVDSIGFGIRDSSALYREALAKAVADGRGRAEAMARAAGVSLGGVRVLAEGGAPAPPPIFERSIFKTEAAASAPTPVVPGELTVRAQVSIEFAVR